MNSFVDFNALNNIVRGLAVAKPSSGTLSGHAAGEPFDKAVYNELKKVYGDKIFRQYEYLNFLYRKHIDAISLDAKKKLFESPTVLFLLSRSDGATKKWSISNPFEEKQNDTADILAVDGHFFDLIDVKTRNIAKSAQPPNIISAYKLAQLCATMIDNAEYDNFTIDYFEVDWALEHEKLICKNTHHANLFKARPESLYINWTAAMQIQFHAVDCDQTFSEDREKWARDYLRHFVTEAERRASYMTETFVDPFKKYI